MQLSSSYAGLSDIDDVALIDPTDRECLERIREVLRTHGKLDRFGVTLLHSHFPVYEDETIIETCDPKSRRLTLEVVKSNTLPDGSFTETAWRLNREDASLRCLNGCVVEKGRHKPKHVQTS